MSTKKEVKFTNLDKIYWPDEKYTKGDLINYYSRIAPFILPYLKGRPLSLKRNPNGIRDKGFYHKDAGDTAPSWMTKAPFYAPSANKTINYLVCNDKPSLLYIANMGCIEMNPWSSTVVKPDHPDYLAIDIDPSDKNTFKDVIETVRALKHVMDESGITGFCKTSGASGIHVFLPCRKKYEYDEVRDFAKLIATAVNGILPNITTLERSLSKRSKKQIYLDYLQNSRGQTLACAYSVRPKPGATVSAPIEWKELNDSLHPSKFNIKNIQKRVEKKGDLFKGIFGRAININAAEKKLQKLI